MIHQKPNESLCYIKQLCQFPLLETEFFLDQEWWIFDTRLDQILAHLGQRRTTPILRRVAVVAVGWSAVGGPGAAPFRFNIPNLDIFSLKIIHCRELSTTTRHNRSANHRAMLEKKFFVV
ncbi:hypothetical protein T07_9237 [Trichinella nelsoni]|uniref:Uncharacterized protein n=1 Tax=Trichinella nelsoni TaxID=6336 RepID=A0A0V0SDQ5_9BILA|nr:hypothetical protein T07_9237 [Trichinella nelsoni]